jgi:hypothetical protein
VKRQLSARGFIGLAIAMIGLSVATNGLRTDDRGVWQTSAAIVVLGAVIALFSRE